MPKYPSLLLEEMAIDFCVKFSQPNAKTLTSFSGRPAARALQGPRHSAGWKHFAEEIPENKVAPSKGGPWGPYRGDVQLVQRVRVVHDARETCQTDQRKH